MNSPKRDFNSPKRDLGIIAVLLQRLENERLPFVVRLRKKVDSGERLSDADIHYLHRAISEAADARLQPLVERHPTYAELVARVFSFYRHIVDRALENEKRENDAGR